jgi:VWFA-related protein
MKLKSNASSILLTFTVAIFLTLTGCGGGGGGGNSAPATPTSADLSLTKTVDVPTPAVDSNVVFTITVTNAGPANATGVIVTDQLPSGFTYVTDDSGGAFNPATGVWSVGSVSAGGSLSLNITATVNDSGNYTNISEITAADQTDPDSEPDNGVPNEDDFASATAAPASINISINQIQTDCVTNPGSTDVKAFATVIDQFGDPVTTLTQNDFTVSEDQIPLDPNDFDVVFAEQIPIPLSVSIVMDYSTSILESNIMEDMENAVIAFIDLLSAVDRAAIIKFSRIVDTVLGFTNDKPALKNAVTSPFVSESDTALYSAVVRGVDRAKVEPNQNRKAVIVITDGRNNAGIETLDDAIQSAVDNNIPVFPIAVGNRIFLPDLERLANETGGILYQATDVNTVEDIYQQIAASLIVNQYVVSYNSSLTGGSTADLTIGAELNGLSDADTRQFITCP